MPTPQTSQGWEGVGGQFTRIIFFLGAEMTRSQEKIHVCEPPSPWGVANLQK